MNTIPVETPLQHLENYGPYIPLVQNGYMEINVLDLTRENVDMHIRSIANIFADGIETEQIRHMKVGITFADSVKLNLTISDYLFNLIFWILPLSVQEPISSEFLFFEENLTQGSIKDYIDSLFLDRYRTTVSNMKLNNIIDDMMYAIRLVDRYSMYFLNTINNEDTMQLMNSNPEFNDLMHADLSNVPLEQVRDVGMDIANKMVDIIKGTNHCMSNAFSCGQGINKKQFKEFMVNIGTKPDGKGGLFNGIINRSYMNGGLDTVQSEFMDATVAREAEIIKKANVGDSGHLSRLMGLNNQGSILNLDPNYSCDTHNLLEITMTDANILDRYKNRWYRFEIDGPEYKMSSNPSKHQSYLIGKTLLFRSPMKCASASKGAGICYKCYGDLAYTNADINIGKMAAEILCSILTQMLLSAKHLLESKAKATHWVKAFSEVCEITYNIISIKNDLDNIGKYALRIHPDAIQQENEDDEFEYNDFINQFEVEFPDGEISVIFNTEEDKEEKGPIYLSNELMAVIDSMPDPGEEYYIIPFEKIKDINLFLMKISNNELSKTLDELQSLINKLSSIQNKTADQWMQDLIEVAEQGGVNIDAVHLEVILSNQIRSVDDILESPQWQYKNEPYQLLTLRQALANHPSIVTTLVNENLPKVLIEPLTYRKKKASELDLFFMEQPQQEMSILLEDEEPQAGPRRIFQKI